MPSTKHPTRPTHCPSETELRDYLSDSLEIQQTAKLEEHVEVCGLCEQKLNDILASQSFAILTAPTIGFSDTETTAVDPVPPLLARYECLGLLDVGGFGTVWKMRDERFNRNVAVKVLKARHAKKPTLVRRFFAEAQICSQLSHPYIVPVHDMGTLRDGRPYLAMKLVDGQQLNEAFSEEKLADEPSQLMARLQAFTYLCQAISFAHERSVIHRDLKPQNVMIGRHGEVQVMDWGLAKRLDDAEQQRIPNSNRRLVEETTRESPDQTQAGALGTFAYMAPEQANNAQTATQQSDVFSLGAILCELITGKPPYTATTLGEISNQAATGALDGAVKRLRESKVDPRLIDLAVCCLNVEPGKRPENGTAVLRQVQSYLDRVTQELEEQKVEIAQQKLRLHENVKRRRLWIALSAALLVGALASGIFAIRAEQSRRREVRANQAARQAATTAENRADSRRLIIDTFVSAFDRVDVRERGVTGDMTAVELLERTQREIDSPAFTEDRQTKTELKAAIAKSLMNMGRYVQAKPLLMETTADWRLLGNEEELASDLSRLSVCHEKLNEYDQAEVLAKETFELTKKLYGPDSVKTLKSCNDLAVIYSQQGKPEIAIPMLKENLGRMQRMLGPNDIETLINTYTLAAAHLQNEEFELAFDFSQDALAGLKTHFPEHPITLDSITNQVAILDKLDRNKEALAMLEKNFALMKKKLSLGHEGTLGVLQALGQRYESSGKIDKAIEYFEEALTFHEQTNSNRVYKLKNSLANYYQYAGKLRESLAMFKDAYLYANRTYSASDVSRVTFLNNLAFAHIRLGEYPAAIPLLEDLLRNFDDEIGLREKIISRKLLATGYQRTQQLERAIQLFRDGVKLAEDSFEPGHPFSMVLKSDLAGALNSAETYDEAEKLYREVIELQDSAPVGSVPLQGRIAVTSSLGTVLQNRRRLDEAIPLFEKAYNISLKIVPKDNPDTVRCKINLGTAYLAQNRVDEGAELLEDALNQAKSVLGANHRITEMALANLQNVWLRRKDYGNAKLNGREWISVLETIQKTRDLPRARIYQADALIGLGEYQVAKDLLSSVENGGDLPPYELSVLKHLQSWLTAKLGDAELAETQLLESFKEIEYQHSTIDVDDRWYASRAAERIAEFFTANSQTDQAKSWQEKSRQLGQLPAQPQ